MPSPFADKLAFALKALGMSRGRLAAELGVDKSVVGRWVTGAVKPSAHNLTSLTAVIALRSPGFTVLDWDRDLDGLAALLGVDPLLANGGHAKITDWLPSALMDQALSTTKLRAGAYEGFYRSTRPYAQKPGRFIHDQVMIRLEENGLLRFDMSTGGVPVEGRVMLLHTQLFCIGAEMTSGSLVFAIVNGVATVQAGMLDGLLLSCALDPGRTPTASAVVFERIGQLSDDPDADWAKFCELASGDPEVGPEDLPASLCDHLVRDIGPAQLATGGDWLLRLPIARSMSRGLDWGVE